MLFSSQQQQRQQHSIANVGGTVPFSLIDYAEPSLRPRKHTTTTTTTLDRYTWLDKLTSTTAAHTRRINNYNHYYNNHTQQQHNNHHHYKFTSSTTTTTLPFSVLSWNILAQSLYDNSHHNNNNNNNHHHQQSNVPFSWKTRLEWILKTILQADADVVCLQEVDNLDVYFDDLLPALEEHGYSGAVQGDETCVREIKRRKGKGERAHVVATFWKHDRFHPVPITEVNGNYYCHMARGRTLTCVLQDSYSANLPVLAMLNCHLEGHPNQYAARIRQLQHAMDDLSKRQITHSGNGQPVTTLNGLVIAGDFNCELQSSACSTYLKIGRVGRKGGLGGVHGTSAIVMPPSILESDEAAQMLLPVVEWGQALPNEDMERVPPHPFRRNSMVSAYPPSLGQDNPRLHFTYCANPNRPVAGLDQIWYSGYSLERLAVKKMFPTHKERKSVLRTGLPCREKPSDHLPIGAMLNWNTQDNDDNHNNAQRVRELIITQDQMPQVKQKSKSPIMAYAELDMLLVTCPYDSEEQRLELEAIVDDVPDLPPDNKKPSEEQMKKLRIMRDRKKNLLLGATEPVREILQRILKLKKEVSEYHP